MRVVNVEEIRGAVCTAVQSLNFQTPEPMLLKLTEIMKNEPSPVGRLAMNQIVENRQIASNMQVPMCQDTGMVIVFVEMGTEMRLNNGDLRTAIIAGDNGSP